MEVPKSLQSTWNEVIKDNKITKQEFSNLIAVAAPNKQNCEFDESEIEFLTSLKNEFECSDSVNSKMFQDKNHIVNISFVD